MDFEALQHQITIREVTISDVDQLAALCQELGYPTTTSDLQHRLRIIEQFSTHHVYISALPHGQLVGWVHVYLCPLVEIDLEAEIGGLVVDAGYRQLGVGRSLMHQAEVWAREQGCTAVRLRSNVVRTDAHVFYERLGYHRQAMSIRFHKLL